MTKEHKNDKSNTHTSSNENGINTDEKHVNTGFTSEKHFRNSFFCKKFLTVACSIVFVFSALTCLTSCTSTSDAQKNANTKIALLFPQSQLALIDESTFSRWEFIQTKLNDELKSNFQESNIFVNSTSSMNEQARKIRSLVETNQINFLVYAANPPESNSDTDDSIATQEEELNNALEFAKDKGVFLIEWDSYNKTFINDIFVQIKDDKAIGRKQAQYIVDKLDLKNSSSGVKNIEIFIGSAGTTNDTHDLFNGIWQVLQPYFASGKLRTLSGIYNENSTYESVSRSILDDSNTKNATNEIQRIWETYYKSQGNNLDAVLTTDDKLAIGVVDALQEQNFFRNLFANDKEKWPVITGYGANKDNVSNIVDQKQSMTVFYDTINLVKKCVDNIKTVANDMSTKDYENDIHESPQVVEPDNLKALLIDPGYISAADAGF